MEGAVHWERAWGSLLGAGMFYIFILMVALGLYIYEKIHQGVYLNIVNNVMTLMADAKHIYHDARFVMYVIVK